MYNTVQSLKWYSPSNFVPCNLFDYVINWFGKTQMRPNRNSYSFSTLSDVGLVAISKSGILYMVGLK